MGLEYIDGVNNSLGRTSNILKIGAQGRNDMGLFVQPELAFNAKDVFFGSGHRSNTYEHKMYFNLIAGGAWMLSKHIGFKFGGGYHYAHFRRYDSCLNQADCDPHSLNENGEAYLVGVIFNSGNDVEVDFVYSHYDLGQDLKYNAVGLLIKYASNASQYW